MSDTQERSNGAQRWGRRLGGHIVVGIDESEAARKALQWAAAEAHQFDVPLEVLYAWDGIGVKIARETGWVKAVTVEMEREAAEAVIANAIAEALGDNPGTKVTPMAVPGEAAESLIEASRTADLLVVGCRGVGGFDGLYLGSVSEKCVHHAHCPVVVVRDD